MKMEQVFNKIYTPQNSYVDQNNGLINYNEFSADEFSVNDEIFDGLFGIRDQMNDYSFIMNILNEDLIIDEIELLSGTEIRLAFGKDQSFDTILNYTYAPVFTIPFSFYYLR